MYGYHAQGSASMLCQHVADWSRQALRQLERLREQGRVDPRLDEWQANFAALEAEATALLSPWQQGAQAAGAIGRLLERAHEHLRQMVGTGDAPAGAASPAGLPYAYDALEPHIDTRTLTLHHTRHFRREVEEAGRAAREAAACRQVGAHALADHWERIASHHRAGAELHALYFAGMSPAGGRSPGGAVLERIERDFGSVEAFREEIARAARRIQGAGWVVWAWLPGEGRTAVLAMERNQGPLPWGATPLLAIDLWEHAYYLKYQDDWVAYLEAWWRVVDWTEAARRLEAIRT